MTGIDNLSIKSMPKLHHITTLFTQLEQFLAGVYLRLVLRVFPISVNNIWEWFVFYDVTYQNIRKMHIGEPLNFSSICFKFNGIGPLYISLQFLVHSFLQ